MLKTALLDLAGEWPTYGYRRLTAMMQRLGWPVNGKRVRRWMDELQLSGAPPVRTTRTTNSRHALPALPNLVKGLEIQRSGPGLGRRHHLHPFAARVRLPRGAHGCLHARRFAAGTWAATSTRADAGGVGAGLGGGGAADSSFRSRRAVRGHGLRRTACDSSVSRLSMAAVGEPRENGYAERLMRTIKEEEVDLSDYQDFADARRQIGRFLDDVYNVKRIHSSLGYLTPREFEDQWRAERPPAYNNSDLSGG